MNRRLKRVRGLVALLIFVITFNSFSAVVGDNDGGAFITKSEFEALKNNFNSQVESYKNSITEKVDGAIAEYLAGINLKRTYTRSIIYEDAAKYGVISISTASALDYQFGIPMCKLDWLEGRFVTNTNNTQSGTLYQSSSAPSKADRYRQEKTVITDLYANDTNTDYSIAKWDGYYDKCYDEIDFFGLLIDNTNSGYQTMSFGSPYYMLLQHSQTITNVDLTNINPIDGTGCFSTRWGKLNSAGTQRESGVNSSAVLSYKIGNIRHEWGTIKYPYVSVLNDYKYDMFSNKERDFNWSYGGTYKKNFKDHGGVTFANGTDTINGNGRRFSGNFKENNVCYHFFHLFANGRIPCTNGSFDRRGISNPYNSSNYWRVVTQSGNAEININFAWNSGTGELYIPTLGFETKYLKKWSQVYYDGSATIAKSYQTKGLGTANSVLTNSKDPTNITYHLGLTSGFPLIQIDKNSQLRYNLKFEDTTKDYVVWVSNSPFLSSTHPDNDPNCLKLNGLEKANVGKKGYLVKKGKGTFTTDVIEPESTIFIKWGIYNKDLYKIAGGILKPEKEGFIIK